MKLSNSQYAAVMRRYDRRQEMNRRALDQRREEIARRLPQYDQLEQELNHVYAEQTRAAILGRKPDRSRIEARTRLIRSRQAQLLEEAGYPADYLEEKYDCPLCHDTGYQGSQQCSCFKKEVIHLFYEQSNIQEILQKENLDTFRMDYYSDQEGGPLGISPRRNMEHVLAAVKSFIRDFDKKGGNLLLYGDTGVGKTFLVNCIARELIESTHMVLYLTSLRLVDLMERRAFRPDEEPDPDLPSDAADRILDCDLLIIDDLGTELNNAFVNSRLFYCINERLSAGRSTVISTNLTPEQIQERYSERISSRLISSSYTPLLIYGQDIRILKAISE